MGTEWLYTGRFKTHGSGRMGSLDPTRLNSNRPVRFRISSWPEPTRPVRFRIPPYPTQHDPTRYYWNASWPDPTRPVSFWRPPSPTRGPYQVVCDPWTAPVFSDGLYFPAQLVGGSSSTRREVSSLCSRRRRRRLSLFRFCIHRRTISSSSRVFAVQSNFGWALKNISKTDEHEEPIGWTGESRKNFLRLPTNQPNPQGFSIPNPITIVGGKKRRFGHSAPLRNYFFACWDISIVYLVGNRLTYKTPNLATVDFRNSVLGERRARFFSHFFFFENYQNGKLFFFSSSDFFKVFFSDKTLHREASRTSNVRPL